MSRLIVCVLLLLPLTACTSGDPDPEQTATPWPAASTPTAAATPTPSPTPAPSPTDDGAGTETTDDAGAGQESTLDDRLAFVLGVMNGAELDEASYTSTFAEVFRNELSYEQFVATLDQITASAPYTLGEERSREDDALAVEAVGADGTALVINLHLDGTGQIDGLFLSPAEAPTLDEPVSSLEDAVDRLSEMGTLTFAASTVDGEACTTDLGVAADEPAAIGSAFKLYVLGAVVDAIDAGTLAWTDTLEITEDVKSLPSGVLQDREAGSQVTVAEAAELMISISDNTATDLLLHAVGRQAVEDAQAAWGHADPQLNMPFLTTRELFVLKAADEAVQQEWVEGDEATRRDLLTDLADRDLPPVSMFIGEPIRPGTIEWFASPEDLCEVLARLHARFGDPGMAPLAQALTANPGIPDEEGRWSEILFKGGSEPGLVTTAFLVTDAEGGTYALTASVVDPQGGFDDTQAILVMGAARDLLPAEG